MSGASLAFLKKELREISRDRRALMLAFVLPVLVYPATFSLTSSLGRQEAQRARETEYRVAVTGDAEALRMALRARHEFEVVRPVADSDLAARVREGYLEAWVDAPDGIAPRDDTPAKVRIVYHSPHEASRDAEERIRDVLEKVRRRDADRRFRTAGGRGSLEQLVAVDSVDVATRTEAGGARAGRMIPLLLVMTLFIGGSSLSTDLFAGEKERGTLETLYLTPVHRSRIARAKFFVVWSATSVTGVLNLASLLACYHFGLIGDPQDPTQRLTVGGGGITTAFLLVVPLAALVGGVLLGISAFARSLKEAQFYVMPAMLVAVVPGMIATGQEVRLDAFTALLPIGNVALAVRDGLVGPVPSVLLALVAAASVGWGWLAMRWTTGVLSREDTILGFDPEPLLARTPAGRRRAAFVGMALSVLAYFYLGSLLQSWKAVAGLVLSLWALLPLLGGFTGALAWSGGSVRELLSLRRPSAGALVAGLCLGAGAVIPMMKGFAPLQARFLPTPEALFEPIAGPFEKLSLALTLFLLAVSPGICEELLFRGVFLGSLRRAGTTRGAVLASATFFALIHLSIFRFLPTFLIGLLLALVVVRTGSIFPSMLLHAAYNGGAVLLDRVPALAHVTEGARGWALSAALVVVAAILLGRGVRRR